jgi:NAD(P)H-flavin reductase
VIVAGGIGLAPLRPVLYHVLAHRDRYERVMLLYGSRSPSDLLYVDEVQEWRSRLDMTVMITVDTADADWHGGVGVVTKLVTRAPFDAENTIAMVCGPSIMMRFTRQSLEAEGVTPDRTYVSMERNMKCGIGICGHCQFGSYFVCKDGPVHSCGDSEELCWMKEV